MDILKLGQRVDSLKLELDKRVARNQLIASNVANVDTPGYKARDLDFESLVASESERLDLRRTDGRHLGVGAGEEMSPVKVSSAAGRPDGNNVQMEEEMLKLTQNNIEYNVLVQLVSKRLSGVRRTIEGIK